MSEHGIHFSVVLNRSWWCHQMETFSTLLAICAGNSLVTGEFPAQNQWRGALMFSLICAYMNGWVNNGEAGDLRCHRAHYDVTAMCFLLFFQCSELLSTKWMKSGLSITWINKCHWSILWNNMFWIMQWMSLLLISQLDKPRLFLAATDIVHVNIAAIINCNWLCYIYI